MRARPRALEAFIPSATLVHRPHKCRTTQTATTAMVKRKEGERAEGPPYARMTPILRGVIYGLFLAG